MEKVKHIVSFSGGKDSTAMLLKMIEKGMQIDKIICIDTTKEFPEMYEHIKKVQEYIRPYEIEIVKIDFDYWFQDYVLTKGKNKGKSGYGWPNSMFRWCSGLKIEAFRCTAAEIVYNPRRWGQRKQSYIDNKHIYIGYALEEKSRCKTNQNEGYPLIEWNMAGKDCLEYCCSKGFDWGGLYEKTSRVSCYCCPLQRISDYKLIFDQYQELWQTMKEMDKKSYKKFKVEYTLEQLEDRFEHNSLWNFKDCN